MVVLKGSCIVFLIPSSGIFRHCFYLGGCGKRWKTQNILLGKSTEKRNSDYCFVLASVLVTGPLRSQSPESSDPVNNLRNILYKIKLHGPSATLLQWVMPGLKIALTLNWTRCLVNRRYTTNILVDKN